ncbi:MAG: zf-HC2 domain-containing protein [Gemmatimonadota bacterium]
MNEPTCPAEISEQISVFESGEIGPEARRELEAHLAMSAECRAELELVQALHRARPVAPSDLADRVVGAVQRHASRPQTRWARPWWGLSAAAVAALALGIGVTSNDVGSEVLDAPDFATELEEEDLWLSGDGLVAGAPALDGLSDAALAQLLEELETGDGGSA